MGLEEIKRFVLDGSYTELKKEEARIHILKSVIREEQDRLDLKRIVWEELGVVGEFETFKVYEYNYEELKSSLHNVGILPLVTYIKSDDLTEEELGKIAHIQATRKRYLRFSPSNVVKQCQKVPLFDFNISKKNLLDKVDLWRESYFRFEQLNKIWKREKIRALVSPELKSNNKLTFEGGTFSLLETPKKYRTDRIIGLFDTESILNNAVVDFDKLDEFTARGFLKVSELSIVRKVVDVQRRYLLMTIQKEKKKKDYWYSKLERLSKLSKI